jgi:hypothetical protein
MIRKLLAPLAAAALVLSLPGVAAAQAPAAAVADAADLATRFDPPLDKPLRYKLTQEKVRDGKAESSVMEQEVTYTRGSEGVVLTLRPLRVTSGATTIDLTDPKAPLPPMLKPLMGPVAFDLDSDGAIVRVRGWEDYKKNLIAAIPAIAAQAQPDKAKRSQAETFLRDFFGKYIAASAEQAPQLVMKGWPDVLDLMGTSAREGAVVETASVASVPMFPQPLNYKVQLKISRPASGNALRIEVTSVPDPVELKAAIKGFVQDLLKSAPGVSANGGGDLESEFAGLDLTMTMVVDLDARTGLVRRAVLEKHLTLGKAKGFERITIEAM